MVSPAPVLGSAARAQPLRPPGVSRGPFFGGCAAARIDGKRQHPWGLRPSKELPAPEAAQIWAMPQALERPKGSRPWAQGLVQSTKPHGSSKAGLGAPRKTKVLDIGRGPFQIKIGKSQVYRSDLICNLELYLISNDSWVVDFVNHLYCRSAPSLLGRSGQ